MVFIGNYILLSSMVFVIALIGILINRRNLISILMCLELMLLASSINFVAFSSYHHNLTGQVFSIFILTVAAAEAAIGLAIMIVFYNNRSTIRVSSVNQLKG